MLSDGGDDHHVVVAADSEGPREGDVLCFGFAAPQAASARVSAKKPSRAGQSEVSPRTRGLHRGDPIGVEHGPGSPDRANRARYLVCLVRE